MSDNDNEKIPRYTVNHEKAEEYLKKVDDTIECIEEFTKKLKEIKESGN